MKRGGARRTFRSGPLAAAPLLALAPVLAGCGRWTQRYPEPLPPAAPTESDAAGDPVERSAAPGFAASVLRHAGPVWVLAPGQDIGRAIPFYDKHTRTRPGERVRVGGHGRAELVWPGTSTSVVLFENALVRLGRPGTDDALLAFEDVARAQLQLTPQDRIALPGGAEVRGHATRATGPLHLERLDPDLLRIVNRSKLSARILYRDALLELGPGDSLDLPRLAFGTAPTGGTGEQEVVRGGVTLGVRGQVEPIPGEGALRIRAAEEAEVSSQGVRIRLDAGEEAVFSSLEAVVPPRTPSAAREAGTEPDRIPQDPQDPQE